MTAHDPRFEPSVERTKLELWLEEQPPGRRISWLRIADETGIRMTDTNKGKLRDAAEKLQVEYLALKGEGIEIVCAATSREAVTRRLQKACNSIYRVGRTSYIVLDKHGEEMDDFDRSAIQGVQNHIGATLSSISVSKAELATADKRKKLIASEIPNMGKIPISDWAGSPKKPYHPKASKS